MIKDKDRRLEYHRKYYQEHKEQWKPKTKEERRAAYERHGEKIRARAREYYALHREERKACEKLYYQRNREKYVRGARNSRATLKAEVLTYYGEGVLACVACGENQLPCLTLDHVNNDGNKQRKETGIIGGIFLYKYLKDNDYPTGYQTLCMNCQYIKRDLVRKSLQQFS